MLGIVKNPKIRIPILLPNFPTQCEAGWEKSKLVYYWEWLGWITTLEKFSKINSFSASQSLEDLKTCLSAPSFEQRSSKLPFWTFPSNLALKLLSKANFRTIYQLFKITQLSCHSTAPEELWKSRNCTGLEVRKCAFVFISTFFDLEQVTSLFNSRICSPMRQESKTSALCLRNPWGSARMGWTHARQIRNTIIAYAVMLKERKGSSLGSGGMGRLHSGSTEQHMGFRMRHTWDRSPALPLKILSYDLWAVFFL